MSRSYHYNSGVRSSGIGCSILTLVILFGGVALVIAAGYALFYGAIGYGGVKAADSVRVDRAYEAVTGAGFIDPRLIETYYDNYADYCHAADDAAGYHFRATNKAGDVEDVVVCCGSVIATRPCLAL